MQVLRVYTGRAPFVLLCTLLPPHAQTRPAAHKCTTRADTKTRVGQKATQSILRRTLTFPDVGSMPLMLLYVRIPPPIPPVTAAERRRLISLVGVAFCPHQLPRWVPRDPKSVGRSRRTAAPSPCASAPFALFIGLRNAAILLSTNDRAETWMFGEVLTYLV